MNKRILLTLIVMLSGIGLTLITVSSVARRRGGSVSVPDPDYLRLPAGSSGGRLAEFELTERSGKTIRWADLERQVRVVGFFFSSCPANCLQQNLTIREIQRSYAGKDVVFLSITSDPETDSLERLREYATKLEAPSGQWLFLTGGLPYVRQVANDIFGVALDKRTHSESLIVTDAHGQIRGSFELNRLDRLAELRLLVESLLQETTAKSKNLTNSSAATNEADPAETVPRS